MPELKRRYGNFPKLSNAFTTVVAIVGAIGVWAIGHSALKNAEDFQIASHEAAAQSGATALSMVFSNALHREWESLQAVAENVDVSSPASMKSFADAVTEASNRVAWAGVANLHGKVVAGSNRIMEGSDVSEEGWFRKALKGPTVGQIEPHLVCRSLHLLTRIEHQDQDDEQEFLRNTRACGSPSSGQRHEALRLPRCTEELGQHPEVLAGGFKEKFVF
ncbi:hypothetical protein [Thalassococcus profundi]|uniref:hypothetical protein n=1 Tax=Thalassococcus profundi TaxID=2282382 RepID=UPI0011C0770A|nr:hypothetical protein [Thalassococcus profundi]